jgi:hypothetical protein
VIYYPSTRVRLVIRFEDYGVTKTPKPPSVLQTKRRGTFKKQEVGKLKVVRSEGGSLRLAGPDDSPNQTSTPQNQIESLDGFTHAIDGIIPLGASYSRNGIRTADTLNLTLNYRDFPIDPRVIRSCAVIYFQGSVSAEDYERGMAGEIRAEGVPPGALIPMSVIPDSYIDVHGNPRTNKRFEGWADEWEMEMGDDSSATISLSCTDNTRPLLEQPHPTKMSIGIDKPIDEAIAEYLANFPLARGLSVEYRPRGEGIVIPVLKESLTKQAYPPGIGPPTGKDGNSNVKVWDYLTDIATSVGHTIRVVGTTVVIQKATTLYDDRFPKRSDDPFVDRVLPNGRTLRRRLMLWGANCSSLRGKRGLTKYAPTNVEVRSFNPARKRTLVARYPSFVRQQKVILPGESADAKYLVKTVEGVADEETLASIAQSVFEQMQRRELEFTISTKELMSFGGVEHGLDPDLLDLADGDTIDLEMVASDVDESTTVADIEKELRARPREYLENLGYPTEFAAAYADSISDIGFQTTFKVREVQFDWDSQSEGISLVIRVMNFIEVRASDEMNGNASRATDSTTPIVVRDNQ